MGEREKEMKGRQLKNKGRNSVVWIESRIIVVLTGFLGWVRCWPASLAPPCDLPKPCFSAWGSEGLESILAGSILAGLYWLVYTSWVYTSWVYTSWSILAESILAGS